VKNIEIVLEGENIYESHISKGISKAGLSKADSPIGLFINNKTTAEIEISIAAKVIPVKNTY
jgi:xanthine/CO dehydrogenase XdhC/CoxF family maturation factor